MKNETHPGCNSWLKIVAPFLTSFCCLFHCSSQVHYHHYKVDRLIYSLIDSRYLIGSLFKSTHFFFYSFFESRYSSEPPEQFYHCIMSSHYAATATFSFIVLLLFVVLTTNSVVSAFQMSAPFVKYPTTTLRNNNNALAPLFLSADKEDTDNENVATGEEIKDMLISTESTPPTPPGYVEKKGGDFTFGW